MTCLFIRTQTGRIEGPVGLILARNQKQLRLDLPLHTSVSIGDVAPQTRAIPFWPAEIPCALSFCACASVGDDHDGIGTILAVLFDIV